MALAVLERNALLEEVWAHLTARDYAAIVELVGELPLEEHLREPALGVILCSAWFQVGELDRSLLLIQQLTEVCERRGNTWLSRRRMNCEGLIYLARAEPNTAEPILQQVLSCAEDAEDHQMMTWAHNNLGIVYLLRGTWDFALSHFRRSILVGQRIGETRHIALSHTNMGVVYQRAGRFKEARAHFDSAAEIATTTASEGELAHIDWSRASLFDALGDAPLARATADQAWKRFYKLKNRIGMAGVLNIYGRILTKEGREADALACLNQGLAEAKGVGGKEQEAFLMESLADLYEFAGNHEDMVSSLEQSVDIFTRIGSPFQVARLRSRLEAHRRGNA